VLFLLLCICVMLVTVAHSEQPTASYSGAVAYFSQASQAVPSGTDSVHEALPGKPFLRRALPYAGIFAGGAALFALDENINDFTRDKSLHSLTTDRFFGAVEDFGRVGPYLIAVPLLGAHGLIYKDKRSLRVAEELTAGLFLAQGITGSVKSACGRLRPYESDSPYRFFKKGTSFYSGHAVTIWTFATILSKNYPRQDLGFIGVGRDIHLLPIISYSIASMVCLQRLYSDDHWASDVYFGALAGYSVGTLVVHFGNKLHGVSVTAFPAATAGLSVSYNF